MRIRGLVVVLVTSMALSGCTQQSSSVIEIQAGDVATTRVTSSETPKYSRVIALANGSAEIIDSLGLKQILIGRDIASTEPALKSIPIVTSGHQVVVEKILALNPDLVIIDASVGPTTAIEQLKKSKINVELINEVWTVEAISQKVRELADILGVPQTGAALVKELEVTTDSASKQVEGSPRVLFLYLRGGNSIYLVGGKGSGADSLFASVGAIDVGAANSAKPFAPLTAESLISMKPDLIVVMIKGLESVGGVTGLTNLPGVAQTPAGKQSRVIAVDDSLLLSFGTRTPSLLTSLAQAFNEVRK
jgi:iron complex transport system substrate-binding protein